MSAIDKSKNHTVGVLHREYMVDRAFQVKYAALLAGSGVLISVLCGTAAYWAHRQVQGELAFSGHFGGGDGLMIWVVIAVSLVMALGLSVAGILLTHRVAGPIYVMTKQLSDLARGRYPSLRSLRRGDELREFFDLFQQAILLIRSREQEEVLRLESAIAALSQLASSQELKETVAALEHIRARKQDALFPPKATWKAQPPMRA